MQKVIMKQLNNIGVFVSVLEGGGTELADLPGIVRIKNFIMVKDGGSNV